MAMTERGATLVCLAPLRIEALAVSSGLRRARPLGKPVQVVRTGAGWRRASATAGRLTRTMPLAAPAPVVAITGVCGGLAASLTPGELVVADVVVAADGSRTPLRSAAGLAAALTDTGLSVRLGSILTTSRLVRGADRHRLAEGGALAVDLETAALVTAPWPGPVVVVRAVVDTADAELASTSTLRGGRRALAALGRAAPVLAEWAGAALSSSTSSTDNAGDGPMTAGVPRS